MEKINKDMCDISNELVEKYPTLDRYLGNFKGGKRLRIKNKKDIKNIIRGKTDKALFDKYLRFCREFIIQKNMDMSDEISDSSESVDVDKDKIIEGLIKDIANKDKEIVNKDKEIERLGKIPKHGDRMLFRDLVKNHTGFEVIKANEEHLVKSNEYALEAQGCQLTEYNNEFHNKNGVIRKRFNECGNDMEKRFQNTDIMSFSKSCGYPDLQTNKFYLEVKFASIKSLTSTLRSFYVSTLDKIDKSLPHILICFIHEDGKLNISRPPIVKDLYSLEVVLKCEWQSNNKSMY